MRSLPGKTPPNLPGPGNCYSEDMQTGQTVNDRLTIHNPFDAALDSFG
jgi:hypothetical protein